MIEHEKSITANIKKNQKMVYKYFNSKRKIKESVSYVKDENNKLSTNSKETAHLLGKFFVSTFTNEPHGPLEERFYKKSTQPQLNEFELTELSV